MTRNPKPTPAERKASNDFENAVMCRDYVTAEKLRQRHAGILGWVLPSFATRYACGVLPMEDIERLIDDGLIDPIVVSGTNFGELLWESVDHQRLDILMWLVQRNDQVGLSNDHLTKALSLACVRHRDFNHNLSKSVGWLLSMGASVDGHLQPGNCYSHQTVHGRPLCNAATHRDVHDILDLLLGHGADVNLPGANGKVPLVVAAGTDGGVPIMERLVAAGAKTDIPGLLTEAASESRGLSLHALLTKGWTLDPSDANEALLQAASVQSPNMLRKLVALGADVGWLNEAGVGALLMAIRSRRWGNALALLEMGAEVNEGIVAAKGAALEAARADTKESIAVLRQLLEAGCELPQRVGERSLLQELSRKSDELKRVVRSHQTRERVAGAFSDVVCTAEKTPSGRVFTSRDPSPL